VGSARYKVRKWRILVVKLERKRKKGRSRIKWMEGVEKDLKKVECG
jgi:hypothetical protein